MSYLKSSTSYVFAFTVLYVYTRGGGDCSAPFLFMNDATLLILRKMMKRKDRLSNGAGETK